MGLLDRLFGKRPAAPPASPPASVPSPASRPATTAGGGPAQTGGGATLFSLGSEPAKARRTVVEAPLIVAEADEVADDGGVRIKAQPTPDGTQCKLMVSRAVLPGLSWWFADRASSAESPLAERLFAIQNIGAVLVDESTVVVTLEEGERLDDWRETALQLGRALREHVESGAPALADRVLSDMPDEGRIRDEIQRVLDLEVNPGVAAHSGHIALTRVRGNSVYIEMGGGCQGCSAADVTLKQGVHRAFRDAVPFVGAIYDETDHTAGENPYFRDPLP